MSDIYLPADVLYARILKRVTDRGDGCLTWQGATNSKGYGCIASGRKGKNVLTHHVAVLASGRPIPDEMTVDHLCMNKLCVRSEHLEVVTRAENSRRGAIARGHRPRLRAA